MHANDMMGFGQVFQELGRYPRAASLFEGSLAIMGEELGKSHLATIEVSSCLAKAYWRQGRWNEAEKIFVEVLEQRQQLLSKNHPDTVTATFDLASAYPTYKAGGKKQRG